MSDKAEANAGQKVSNDQQIFSETNFSDIKVPEGVSLFTQDVAIEQPNTSGDNGRIVKTESETGKEQKSSEDTIPIGSEDTKAEDKEDEEVRTFLIGEKEYSEEQIKDAIRDSENKYEWQKSNTEKAQEVAATRKAIEPLVQLVNKLKDAGETVNDIKTILTDSLGEDTSKLVDLALTFDSTKFVHPAEEENASLKEELATKIAADFLKDELSSLRDTHKISSEQADKVQEWAVNKFNETGQAYSLEDAYKLMNFDSVQEKLKNKKMRDFKNTPTLPDKSGGAKNIDNQQPEPTTYKEIKYDPVKDGALFV